MNHNNLELIICEYISNLGRLDECRDRIEDLQNSIEKFETAHDKIALEIQKELEDASKSD